MSSPWSTHCRKERNKWRSVQWEHAYSFLLILKSKKAIKIYLKNSEISNLNRFWLSVLSHVPRCASTCVWCRRGPRSGGRGGSPAIPHKRCPGSCRRGLFWKSERCGEKQIRKRVLDYSAFYVGALTQTEQGVFTVAPVPSHHKHPMISNHTSRDEDNREHIFFAEDERFAWSWQVQQLSFIIARAKIPLFDNDSFFIDKSMTYILLK